MSHVNKAISAPISAVIGKTTASSCAPGNIARTFLQSDIKYSLLLFDETAEGAELQRFARSLTHRKHTPVILVKKSEDPGRLFDIIKRRLSATRAP